MSVKRILGDGKEEKRLCTFIRESGVGLRPPEEIWRGEYGPPEEEAAELHMDALNEFADFFYGWQEERDRGAFRV